MSENFSAHNYSYKHGKVSHLCLIYLISVKELAGVVWKSCDVWGHVTIKTFLKWSQMFKYRCTNVSRTLTYHFSRTEELRVHLHVHNPCLLATANLLFILSFPPGKRQTWAGTSVSFHLFNGSFFLIISCSVCFLKVSADKICQLPFFFLKPAQRALGTVKHIFSPHQCLTQEGGEWEVKRGGSLSFLNSG